MDRRRRGGDGRRHRHEDIESSPEQSSDSDYDDDGYNRRPRDRSQSYSESEGQSGIYSSSESDGSSSGESSGFSDRSDNGHYEDYEDNHYEDYEDNGREEYGSPEHDHDYLEMPPLSPRELSPFREDVEQREMTPQRDHTPEREFTPARDDSPINVGYRSPSHDETIEEALRDEISNLKRKLNDSRRETRKRDLDNDELRRSLKMDDFEYGKLYDKYQRKKMDFIDMKYKYKKAEEAKRTLNEDNYDLSDVVEQYFSSKEIEKSKRRKVERDLSKAKRQNKDLKAKIKEIENGEKYMETVAKERKRADNYRNMMLKMMQQMQTDHKEANGGPPTWKMCEICDREYDDSADKIPRFLSCGHTVCSYCIGKIANGLEVRCPFDRTFTYLESSDVTKLPKNYAVLNM